MAGAAHAAQSEIDLSSLTNANLQTYTDGTNYPTAGSTVSIGAAIILWYRRMRALRAPQERSRSLRQATASSIPINQTGYSIVYVLVNSAFGVLGETVGSLVFEDSAGDTDTISLEEGTNIRDHWTAYNDVSTDIYGTATYAGGVRFDAYEYCFPLRSLATR